ncbi:hypothetical protein KQI84_19360 [bacterium]|nr:hypothetical protein [bacterium]
MKNHRSSRSKAILCLVLISAFCASAQSDEGSMLIALDFVHASIADIAGGIVWNMRETGSTGDVVLEVRTFIGKGYFEVLQEDQGTSGVVRFDHISIHADSLQECAEQLAKQTKGYRFEFDPRTGVFGIIEEAIDSDPEWPLNMHVGDNPYLVEDCLKYFLPDSNALRLEDPPPLGRTFVYQCVSQNSEKCDYVMIWEGVGGRCRILVNSFPLFAVDPAPRRGDRIEEIWGQWDPTLQ